MYTNITAQEVSCNANSSLVFYLHHHTGTDDKTGSRKKITKIEKDMQ